MNEKFLGVNPVAIKQDFYATIYLSNLMTTAKNETTLIKKLNQVKQV